MKLLAIGVYSETAQHFIQHARKQGFTVEQVDGVDRDTVYVGADAIVCLPGHIHDASSLDALCDMVAETDTRRLIIVTTLSELALEPALRSIDVDWTVVQTLDQAESLVDDQSSSARFLVAAKDLAKFLVNQITDSRYIQATVLVKN